MPRPRAASAPTAAVHEGCLRKAVEAARDQGRHCPACPALRCARPLDELDAVALLGADIWQRTKQLMSRGVAQATVRPAAQPAPPSPCR